jgi:chromate transporter
MIAQIKDLAVRRRNWVDDPTFDDGVVLSQSLPGATAMQVAAYVGLRRGGRSAPSRPTSVSDSRRSS